MFHINQRSAKPIYEQIVESVELAIASGALQKDEKLPSVRQVAKELAVNPNTIQRAYALLEERGLTYSQPGRGRFAAMDAEDLGETIRPEAFTRLEAAVEDLAKRQVALEKIMDCVITTYDTCNKGGGKR